MQPGVGPTLVHNVQKVTRQHHHLEGLACLNGDVTMAVGILVGSDCARKEISEHPLFRVERQTVCQGIIFPERFPHEYASVVPVWKISGLPNHTFSAILG